MTIKISYDEHDRLLKGPATYEKYNALAKKSKNDYIKIVRFQLIDLFAISFLYSAVDFINAIWHVQIIPAKTVQYINLFLILTLLFLMIWQYRPNKMMIWQKARFLAESTLSEAWYFLFAFDIYKKDLEASKRLFSARISLMKNDLKIPAIVDAYEVDPSNANHEADIKENDCPQWISDNFGRDLAGKTEYYIRYRIDDQLRYYTERTIFNTKRGNQYFWVGLLINGVGAFLTVLAIGGTLPNYAYLGLFTTISAAFISWTQTKRHEELGAISSVASEELTVIKRDLENILEDLKNARENQKLTDKLAEGLERKIFESEKLISREHKVKRD